MHDASPEGWIGGFPLDLRETVVDTLISKKMADHVTTTTLSERLCMRSSILL